MLKFARLHLPPLKSFTTAAATVLLHCCHLTLMVWAGGGGICRSPRHGGRGSEELTTSEPAATNDPATATSALGASLQQNMAVDKPRSPAIGDHWKIKSLSCTRLIQVARPSFPLASQRGWNHKDYKQTQIWALRSVSSGKSLKVSPMGV